MLRFCQNTVQLLFTHKKTMSYVMDRNNCTRVISVCFHLWKTGTHVTVSSTHWLLISSRRNLWLKSSKCTMTSGHIFDANQ